MYRPSHHIAPNLRPPPPQELIDWVIKARRHLAEFAGYRRVHDHLRTAYGIVVDKARVCCVIRALFPLEVKARDRWKNGRFIRSNFHACSTTYTYRRA